MTESVHFEHDRGAIRFRAARRPGEAGGNRCSLEMGNAIRDLWWKYDNFGARTRLMGYLLPHTTPMVRFAISLLHSPSKTSILLFSDSVDLGILFR